MKLRMSTKIMLVFAVLYIVFFTIENLPKYGNEIQSFNLSIISFRNNLEGFVTAKGRVALRKSVEKSDKVVVSIVIFSKDTPESEFEETENIIKMENSLKSYRYSLPIKFGNLKIIKKIMIILYEGETELDQKYIDFRGIGTLRSRNYMDFITRKQFDQITD
ncbi:hypothetical protein KAJ27_19135 [bacterium]|nr:hypothetical protein [bacterium]